jgi:PAS domain S-box-containing protein
MMMAASLLGTGIWSYSSHFTTVIVLKQTREHMGPSGTPARGISLLYIDDEPDLLEIARQLLELRGDFSVTPVSSGPEAFRILREQQFDAIVCDYQMPGMNGIAFLKELRTQGNDIPFIIFTGRGREEIAIEALNSGADFYIRKGGDPKSQFAELGNAIRVVVSRKRAEEALRESETRYREFFTTSRDSVFITSPDGRWIDFNDAILEMFGYDSREELLAVPVSAIYAEAEERPAFLAHIEKEGYVQEYPLQGKRRDGTVFDTVITTVPVRNPDGSVKAFIGTIRNITGQKQAEEALRESEETYRTTFENTGTAMVIVEQDSTIVLANGGFAELSGFSKEEIEGKKSWTEFVVREDLGRMLVQHRLRRENREGALKNYQFHFVRRDGSIRDIFLSIDIIPGTTKSVASLLDITEREQALQGILESGAQLQAILQGSPIPTLVIDRNHRVISWNRALEEATGIPAKDMLGTARHWRAFYENERPCLADLLVDGVIDKIPELYGERIRRSEITEGGYEATGFFPHLGTQGKWLRYVAAPIRDATGNLIGAVETLEDVTAQKNAEEALRESEQRYHNIIEDQTEFICRFKPDGTHVFVNEAYARYFSTTRPEMIRKIFRPNIFPDDRERVRKFFSALTPDHPVDFIEHRIIMPDGNVRWQRWSDRAIFDDTGTLVEYQSVGRDITAQKQAEEALRESEQRYYNIIEDQTEFICRFKPDGTHVFVNDAYARYFGAGRGEMIGKIFRPNVFPDDREKVRKFFVSLTPNHPVDFIEHRIIMPDGGVRWQRWSDRAIFDDTGTLVEYQSVGRDITAQKQAAEELQKAHNRLKILNSITRHDIINKITVILGYLTLAQAKSPPPVLGEYLQKMESATRAIKDQIEFTRDYQDLGGHEPLWQELNGILARQRFPATITLNADVREIWIFADPMLEKVFFNLLDNSLMHGQTVTEISVSHTRYGNGLKIVWEDNGVGIVPQEKDLIFERGYGKNTGLGMFLSREILAITGMTIAETGEPGAGARFEISVPEGKFLVSQS